MKKLLLGFVTFAYLGYAQVSPPAGSSTVTVSGNVTVVGPAADGAAASGNPVRVAGDDNGGTLRTLHTDSVGRQVVVGNAATGVAVAGVAVAGAPVSITGYNVN